MKKNKGFTLMELMIAAAIIAIIAAIAIPGVLRAMDATGENAPVSNTGVRQQTAEVETNAKGQTAEQVNIIKRLARTSSPDTICYIYLLSAYTGDILDQDVAVGKITSSKKRLTPTTVAAMDGQSVYAEHEGQRVNIGGSNYRTSEVIQDDGTYGSSMEYLFYFDQDDNYQVMYVAGGTVIRISEVPLQFGRVVQKTEDSTDR